MTTLKALGSPFVLLLHNVSALNKTVVIKQNAGCFQKLAGAQPAQVVRGAGLLLRMRAVWLAVHLEHCKNLLAASRRSFRASNRAAMEGTQLLLQQQAMGLLPGRFLLCAYAASSRNPSAHLLRGVSWEARWACRLWGLSVRMSKGWENARQHVKLAPQHRCRA